MADPRIPLKNRLLAGVLAFLVPGAGHLYQGRQFKAAIYAVCIVGLFVTGMAMADWKAVQPPGKLGFKGTPLYFHDGRNLSRPGENIKNDNTGGGLRSLKFAAQGSMGIPALVSLIQSQRYRLEASEGTRVSLPFDGHFEGTLSLRTEAGLHEGPATGTIHLESIPGDYGGDAIGGTFRGTFEGKPVEYQLGGLVSMGPELSADAERSISASLLNAEQGHNIGELRGTVPRSFSQYFMVTMTDEQEEALQRKLGKKHELAMVLTWIAGLLNLLVIWDAVEGPAYGYGDEEEQPPALATGPPPSVPSKEIAAATAATTDNAPPTMTNEEK